MNRLTLPLCAVVLWLTSRRDDRGDVPGWVMVVVMSAGLIGIIWTVAKGELRDMLRTALNSVK